MSHGTDGEALLSVCRHQPREDNAALIFQPRVGLKWFIRDYFAIDTNLFVAVAMLLRSQGSSGIFGL